MGGAGRQPQLDPLQRAQGNQRRQREESADGVVAVERHLARTRRATAGHRGCRRQADDVHGERLAEHRSGDGSERSGSSGASMELHEDQRPRRIGRAARLLRHRQSWIVVCRRQAGVRHPRRLRDRPRCRDRQAGLGREERLPRAWRDDHPGADHRRRTRCSSVSAATSLRARGAVTAYNLADGKVAWHCYSTGSDKDVCLTAKTNEKHPEYGKAGKDLGISTYPGDEWKRGGGAAWGWYAYDPDSAHGVLRHRQPGTVVAVSIAAPSRSLRRTATAANSTTSGR